MTHSLLVRKVDEDVFVALQESARRHGRSVEAEHRALLRRALFRRKKPSLKDHLLAIPKAAEGDDEDVFARIPGEIRTVDL